MRIFKFPLKIEATVVIPMPMGAKPLHVATQAGAAFVWAAVDPDAPIFDHVFYVRGTGHSLIEALSDQYIGTIHMLNDALIWHVFDGGEE